MSEVNQEAADALLNTDDDNELENLLVIKKTLTYFFDRSAIIDFFIDIVKNSSCIEFERDNPKRYISISKPLLELKMDVASAKKKFPKLAFSEDKGQTNRAEVMTNRSNLVHDEINKNFMTLIENILHFIITDKYDETFKYASYVRKVFPHDSKGAKEKINNFFVKKSKDSILKQTIFVFGLASSVNFPPPDVSLNDDTSFSVEFMI
jgi:hypothetical protein